MVQFKIINKCNFIKFNILYFFIISIHFYCNIILLWNVQYKKYKLT